MTRDNSPPAGLTFAPEYKGDVVDENAIKPVQTKSFDVHQLAYFQEQERRRTFISRMVILGIMFSLVATIIWQINSNNIAMTENTAALQERMNIATMERAAISDQLDNNATVENIAALQAQIDALEESIAELTAE